MKNILAIDDDIELCDLMQKYFSKEDFYLSFAHEGAAGLDLLARERYDLVLLDVMLPGKDGFDVLRSIRSASEMPVIMLTARGNPVDRIVGLELGADDYICKPFNARELLARIRAVLRRFDASHAHEPGQEKKSAEVFRVHDLELSLSSRSVTVSGVEVELTSVEFRMLEVLLGSAGTLVTLNRLSAEALGRRYSAFDRSISVHISNLRRKLGPYQDGGDRIKTLRSEGFIYISPKSPGAQQQYSGRELKEAELKEGEPREAALKEAALL